MTIIIQEMELKQMGVEDIPDPQTPLEDHHRIIPMNHQGILDHQVRQADILTKEDLEYQEMVDRLMILATEMMEMETIVNLGVEVHHQGALDTIELSKNLQIEETFSTTGKENLIL